MFCKGCSTFNCGAVLATPGNMRVMPYLLIVVLLANCRATNQSLTETTARERIKSMDPEAQQHIHALLDMIEEQERLTDPTGKRYIPYEFRIPLDSLKRNEVQRIDPSIQFTPRSDSFQCIGDNATKERVFQVVALPYTSRIQFCPYE